MPSDEGGEKHDAQSASVPDPLAVWERVTRDGAPMAVRQNAWLTAAWAVWCVRKEEPGLFWLGTVAIALVAITQIYPMVRWMVAIVMKFTPS